MKVQPALSVVIPTRNRREYLQHSVLACLAALDEDCELVIVDNSDDASERLEIAERAASRATMVLVRPDRVNNAEENFSAGLDAARGRYVCFIGDDDAVLPGIVPAARWCQANDVDALVQATMCAYVWPDVTFKRFGSLTKTGELRCSVPTGALYPVQLDQEFVRVLRQAGSELGLLPRAYHGVVLTSALRRLRELAGSSFPGPSPDMSSAVALCLTLERVYAVDLPLVLSGKGGKSAGGQGAAKVHEGRLDDVAWIPRRSIEGWSERVPRVFTGVTIWAEDVVAAVTALHGPGALTRFNDARLVAHCVLFHPRFIGDALSVAIARLRVTASSAARARYVGIFVFEYIRGWGERIVSLVERLRLTRGSRAAIRIIGLANVWDAARRCVSESTRLGQDWASVTRELEAARQALSRAAGTSRGS